ncbi:hypothetical protein [Legionella waltersii]|uniref:Uncharacterized protein n=1 Tax=Legionella waltersii TaxID=66969 RepID=A0A0W1ANP6_9GAMM|nr:hypothetical protein [Legionella waltersii]KTD82888.1 hypothetical protein Lwal_0366 [Legionella waltersii]SNV02104.1 Uncharacterised protein [Legionella waltersii]
MRQGQSEIVVLKPTTVFLAFLASQLPESHLPSLNQLETDNTAYVIPKEDSDEATLDHIEMHFQMMFRHEIGRWLGENARNSIETSFIDFVSCFKLEMHSHIILMEPRIEDGHQLLEIKPREALLEWIKSSIEDSEGLADVLDKVSLTQIAENSTVIVKNFANLKDIKPFIELYYQPIFETAMTRMSNQSREWPEVNSFTAFSKYFAVQIHTQLKHLHR